MLGFCPTLRFLWTQILCTLLVSILHVNWHFINRSQLFVCVYIYISHACEKVTCKVYICMVNLMTLFSVVHVSLVDSGNIKIAQHALKSVSFQIVGHHTEEESLFCQRYSVRLYYGNLSLRQFKSSLYSVCTAEAVVFSASSLFTPKLFAAVIG